MREKDMLEKLEDKYTELETKFDELLMQHKGLMEWARKLEAYNGTNRSDIYTMSTKFDDRLTTLEYKLLPRVFSSCGCNALGDRFSKHAQCANENHIEKDRNAKMAS